MSNALLVGPPGPVPSGVAAPDDAVLRAILEPDLGDVADVYYRTWVGTAHAMTAVEAADEVRATWAGGYGSWWSPGSLGAWSDGRLVGTVLTVLDPPWPDVPPGPFLLDLCVVPERRGRGTGRALVRAVLAAATAPLHLRVDDDAIAARELYAALGFRPVTP